MTAATLDIEDHTALDAYLRRAGQLGASEPASYVDLAGGVSCRTVLTRRSAGNDMVLKQALEFLRVAEVWKGDPARVAREAEAMRVLGEILEPGQVPALLFEDESEHLIAMSAVPEPHENWKHMLLRGELNLTHVQQFGSMLGTIHAGSAARADELATRFAGRSQFESLRVEPYYRFTAGVVPELAGWFDELIADTRSTQIALVHGDFSPKNVLIYDDSCVLLDHEVGHWGDPAFDVGFATAHFLGKANHVAALRHEFATAAHHFWASYTDATKEQPWFGDVAQRAVRHSVACALARVRGKSPLEYLTDDERQRQHDAAVALALDAPPTYDGLVDAFVERIS